MPLNMTKVTRILLEEVNSTQERCEGYHDRLKDLMVDIMSDEGQHRLRHTTIQKQIDDRFDAAGRWLADQQS